MSGAVELARIDLPDEAAIRAWCDPLATVKTQPYGLWRAYQPNVAVVGWDLGYTFGQIAEYWVTRRDHSYLIYPYGWGKPRDRGRYTGTSPHRPPLMMRPRAKGWQVWWGKPKSGPPGQLRQVGKRQALCRQLHRPPVCQLRPRLLATGLPLATRSDDGSRKSSCCYRLRNSSGSEMVRRDP